MKKSKAKVSIKLKSGKTIEVLPTEVQGLRKAGLLKEEKQPSETKKDELAPDENADSESSNGKEDDGPSETKEFKEKAETKATPKKRGASISTKNVKGNSPKKV